MSRRGATALAGVLLLDKPAGMTSHDVVAAVRRATGEGRVGHAGTLDPMATGLLIVLVGPYTRLEPYLSTLPKTYEAVVALGSSTDTDDAEGCVISNRDVPPGMLTVEGAEAVLASLVGESMQRPPAYSAIKKDGAVAHRAARAGRPLELAERPIRVDEARLLGVDPASATWRVRFVVSKGTYVRALARDLGPAAGTLAHLAGLRRCRVAGVDVTDARTLDDVRRASEEGRIEELFADPIAVLGLPVAHASAEDVAAGRTLAAPEDASAPEGALFAVVADGRLAGVHRLAGRSLVPAAVLAVGQRP